MSDQSRGLMRAVVLVMAVLAVPPAVFLLTGLFKGMGPGELLSALFDQYTTSRANLLIVGVIGLLPLAVLGIVFWAFKRAGAGGRTHAHLYWGGVLPLFAVLAWSNHEFWRVFLPKLSAPGFPHGLELIIGPVFFAPVAMAAGMLVAWLAGRSRRE